MPAVQGIVTHEKLVFLQATFLSCDCSYILCIYPCQGNHYLTTKLSIWRNISCAIGCRYSCKFLCQAEYYDCMRI
ncbi:hypothetical protein RCIAA2 [Methanocella arvoryzae MRE50]|uniref:Uncharacterized protein n=1 Tax=Methanocella arvoryzae (strain DSM 22066 / NBRC 105507 / MRE50) TaxID=351160 RepID=Q0W6J5_METAR|nr:hypothetical protein RCIAA2 [Methanocella arvoryzae MRE50]